MVSFSEVDDPSCEMDIPMKQCFITKEFKVFVDAG